MRIVIVGAGYAGLACALRLSHAVPHGTQVMLVNAVPHFVERIRLHEHAAARAAPSLPLAELVRGTGIDLRVGSVEQIDLSTRRLCLDGEQLGWDRLVLALGSRAAVDQVPGARDNAFTLDALSAGWLAHTVPSIAARGGLVVVVGGGLTGIEAAAELAEAHPGLRVSLVTRGALAHDLAPRAATHVRSSLGRLGVHLHEHSDVQAVGPRALRTRGAEIPFDACVWSSGFEAPSLARALGLDVNAQGQILCDAKLRALGHDDVYVAGDALALAQPLGAPLPMGCKSAFPTGLHVAENLARSLRGGLERDYVHRPVFFCVSLGRHDGLLQSPSARTRDARHVLTGRPAARLKELICRGTRWMLALERGRARLSRALRLTHAPLLPTATLPTPRR